MAEPIAAQQQDQAEIKGAIAAFERILEVMPTDRLALETLSDAYERLQDQAQAAIYLCRLAEVVLNERDVKTATNLLKRLRAVGEQPGAKAMLQRLQTLLEEERAAHGVEVARTATAGRKVHDITKEVSLAWDLLQAEEISPEDYSNVVHDLSENSTKRIEVPVTVLHALHDRTYKNLDKVMAYLSRTSGRPLLALSSFEFQPEAARLLPLDYMIRRGAMVFERMGQDLLVAVLNPFDRELQEEVEQITGKSCHYYLVSAGDYDNHLAALRKHEGKPAT